LKCLKDATREARASLMKDSKKMLEASMTIAVAGSDADLNLLSRWNCS
jgi:hypothetical protein